MNKATLVDKRINEHVKNGQFAEARAVLSVAVDVGIASRSRMSRRLGMIDRAEEEAYALGAEPPREENA